MLFIIAYHLLSFVVLPNYESTNVTPKAMELIFHSGVVLFVLISGYFSIRLSVKSVLKLLLPILIYYVPAMIVYGGIGFLGGVFWLSKSPYWFVKVYLLLLLLSPYINRLWDKTNRKQHVYIISALAFFSVYMGTIYGEISLVDGKNIVHFVLLYYIGRTISDYRKKLNSIGSIRPFLLYVSLVTCIVLLYINFSEGLIGTLVWLITFRYNSPLLIAESVLLFIAMSNMNINNKLINKFATASYPIYIMHNNKMYLLWLAPAIFNGLKIFNNYQLMVAVVVLSVFTYFAGFIIHQIIKPLLDRVIGCLCLKLNVIDHFIDKEIFRI